MQEKWIISHKSNFREEGEKMKNIFACLCPGPDLHAHRLWLRRADGGSKADGNASPRKRQLPQREVHSIRKNG